MNTQQSSPAADNADIKLQQLTFLKTQDDNTSAIYQAKIGKIEVPDEPVLELTVTMASPAGNDKAAQENEKFLGTVRAGFKVTAPVPDDGPDDGPDPDTFNVVEDILFETDLIRPDPSTVPVGVTVVIQAVLEDLPRSERIPIALANGVLRASAWVLRLSVQSSNVIYLNGSVTKGKKHKYPSKTSKKMKATVTSTNGSAKVDPGSHPIKKYESWTAKVRTATVIGVSAKCYYTVQEVY